MLFFNFINFAFSCTDQPSCFKKGFFRFSMPDDGLYNIFVGDLNLSSSALILGYGDFNNDFYNDMLISNNDRSQVMLALWNKTSYLFDQQSVMQVSVFENAYLVDINYDGYLDFVLYGKKDKTCALRTYLNLKIHFSLVDQSPTSCQQPFLADLDADLKLQFVGVSSQSAKRVVYSWNSSTNQLLQASYSQYISPEFENDGFAEVHYNSFGDLTGDCSPDLLIMAPFQQYIRLQLYVLQNLRFTLKKQLLAPKNIAGFNIGDIDYDGLPDLLLLIKLSDQQFSIASFLNLNPKPTQVCPIEYSNSVYSELVTLNTFEESQIEDHQQSHLQDVDYDGMLDLILLVNNKAMVFKNQIIKNESFGQIASFSPSTVIMQTNKRILSVSLFDILQDGILDYFVQTLSVGFHAQFKGNNFACIFNNSNNPSVFFMKAHSLNGAKDDGALYIGSTFAWRLSLFTTQKKYSHMPQLYLSAFSPKQIPFAEKGLGRSTNYVQDLTLGNGLRSPDNRNTWTPIIPNTQLIVATGMKTSEWSIKAFIKPTDSLLWVMVVTLTILAILGGAMSVLYMKEREQDREDRGFHAF